MTDAAPGRAAGTSRAQGEPARTIFFGSGAFGVPILEALVAMPDLDVVAVVSAPDRPAGRSGTPTAVPVAARAQELGLPLQQPPRLRSEAATVDIAALQPALGVLADYGRIVPPAILGLPGAGILNVHPSLLPRHRGASPISAAILAGDRETGVTIIAMDAGLDTGPIVAVSRWPLTGTEGAPELESRAAQEGAALLGRTVPGWLSGVLVAHAQPEAGATLTRPLRRDDGRIDPARSATDLARQVRAYEPWPGSFIETDGGRIKLLEATVRTRAAGAASVPGTLESEGQLRLITSQGDLVLVRVQPAGGRPMSGEELLRGRPSLAGARVR